MKRTADFTKRQYQEFVERFERFRARCQWTQEEMGKALGVTGRTIRNIENLELVPSMQTVLRFYEVEERENEKRLERKKK